ncbi:MAG: hypothetical protein Fur0010_17150 [Bdellovibrio sp.]
MKSVAVIDCAIERLSIHCYNRLVHHFNIPFTFHYPPQLGIDSLRKSKDSAYIIFGSISNVCDRLEWQVELAEIMKEKLEAGIPVLGICFGHQLMADALGCSVEKNDENRYNEGSRKYKILTSHMGLNAGEELNIITSHGYEVKTLTEDFIHLGTSQECRYDALAHKKFPLLSVQGHPEASDFFVEELECKPQDHEKLLAQRDGMKLIELFLKFAGTLPQNL